MNLRLLWVAVALTFALVCANTWWLSTQSHRLATTANQTAAALCGLRQTQDIGIRELQDQITRSIDVVKNHPEKLGGIDPKLILQGVQRDRESLHQRQRARKALDVLKCD
jgi:hypothetical protein